MPKNKKTSTNNSSGGIEDQGGSGATKLKGAQKINVRHILCAKEGDKNRALAELQAGKAFSDVAHNYSEDKARHGGLLGWKTQAELLPSFAAVAFNTPISKVTSPTWKEAKTSEGYHIIMVEDRK